MYVDWADFTTSFGGNSFFCFVDASNLRFTDELFLARPFSLKAWIVTVCAILACLMLVAAGGVGWGSSSNNNVANNNSGGNHHLNSRGLAMASLLGGLTFTVLSSFYGGALTMFLADGGDPPFSDILDGPATDSSWTLLLARGDEATFSNIFDMSDDKVAAADKKYNSDAYRSTQAATFKETLLQLGTVPRSVLFATRERVTRELSQLGEEGGELELKRFCRPRETSYGFMLPKGSPFVRPMNSAIMRLWEQGEIRRLEKEWFRDVSSALSAAQAPGVALRQVALALALFAGVALGAGAMLAAECYWRNRKKEAEKRTRVPGKLPDIYVVDNKPA